METGTVCAAGVPVGVVTVMPALVVPGVPHALAASATVKFWEPGPRAMLTGPVAVNAKVTGELSLLLTESTCGVGSVPPCWHWN